MKQLLIGSAVIAAMVFVLAGCEGAGTEDESIEGVIDVIGYDNDSTWRNDVALSYTGEEGSDLVTLNSEVADTQAMIDAVAANPEAIGYLEYEAINRGSLNNTEDVTIVTVDSVQLTVANVRNGTYPHSLELFLVWDTPQTDFAQDFVEFAISDNGQDVIDDGFLPIASPGSYTAATGVGTGFALGGSSTVNGIAAPLIDAYEGSEGQSNTAVIAGDYESVGSGAGAQGVIDGDYDLAGMSRDLTSEESTEGLENQLIGYTAWAFIVHPDAPVTAFTTAQLGDILTGTITQWSGLSE